MQQTFRTEVRLSPLGSLRAILILIRQQVFRQVNRAIAARVAAYQEDFPAVLSLLDESFLNLDSTTESLNTGLYTMYFRRLLPI